MHTKYVSSLKFIAAAGDLCAMVITEKALSTGQQPRNTAATHKDRKGGDDEDEDEEVSPKHGGKGKKGGSGSGGVNGKNEVYTIQLRNSIGTLCDVVRYCELGCRLKRVVIAYK